MKYPLIIAFEMSSYEDDAFPVAVAWSLPEGQIKSTLISPDEEWLEQLYDQGGAGIDPEQLLLEGHSAKSVIEELQLDLGDERLYSPDPFTAETAIERFAESLDRELDLPLRPAAELIADSSFEERELCRQECTSMLELSEHQAQDQVRLWLEMYNRLRGK